MSKPEQPGTPDGPSPDLAEAIRRAAAAKPIPGRNVPKTDATPAATPAEPAADEPTATPDGSETRAPSTEVPVTVKADPDAVTVKTTPADPATTKLVVHQAAPVEPQVPATAKIAAATPAPAAPTPPAPPARPTPPPTASAPTPPSGAAPTSAVRRHAPWLAPVAIAVIAVCGLATAADAARTEVESDPATGLPAGSMSVISAPGVPEDVATSQTLLKKSDSAIVVSADADADAQNEAVELADSHHVPVFAVDPESSGAVNTELKRLGVKNVVNVGGEVAGITAPQSSDPHKLGAAVAPIAGKPVFLVSDKNPTAVANARVGGADTVAVPVPDPRVNGESVAAVKRSDNPAIRAVGEEFGDDDVFAGRVEKARTVTELPGGGQILFPGRRVVALYGSPGADALGPLGRQSLPATIRKAKAQAAQYNKLSPVPVVPGFEIIVTVASSEPGPDNNYTNMLDEKTFEPWIDAAEKAGIYVTIDLQPGRQDFLSQAKAYQKLLERPNVGLALDPEWRLKPDQVHLEQIGSVAPEEVNEVGDWLAGLVRRNNLPQKAFLWHYFDADMLGDRTKLKTNHPELSYVIHADGHGIPEVKMGTWNRMVAGLPPNIWMGWKNFYKEDTPMFSPRKTMQVKPTPYFISYQ
ncbi:MAG: hypothetical protein QM774_10085 [Gordonia sp. (in: high G+C Gram-positive bacteria)]|uniref:hypothetical protein n=1 Tax=Gordonia sp. (in: high G+C Gram-positive bacteria) TaxID=84139 RepID=UPI0039E65064